MSFDTLAPVYRLMELGLAGNILQECRTSFLNETISCKHALLLAKARAAFSWNC